MPIDTLSKRVSALKQTLPIPDGSLAQGDRQHVVWHYSGILAVELVLFMVVYGSATLAPWVVQAAGPVLAPWLAVTTVGIEDLTP